MYHLINHCDFEVKGSKEMLDALVNNLLEEAGSVNCELKDNECQNKSFLDVSKNWVKFLILSNRVSVLRWNLKGFFFFFYCVSFFKLAFVTCHSYLTEGSLILTVCCFVFICFLFFLIFLSLKPFGGYLFITHNWPCVVDRIA